MKFLIVAGGTAGHVNPALAIAGYIKSQDPTAEICFAGRRKGMEYGLVVKAGYVFHHIDVSGIQRSFTPENILRNIKAVGLLAASPFKANKILKAVKPDVVIGTGGYVSYPILHAAAKKGIKTAIHEQNAFPGVTNKMLAKEVDMVFVASKNAVEKLGEPEKTIVVGNPVRDNITKQNRTSARKNIGIIDDTVVLLSFGGSLGAKRINEVVADLSQWHIKNRDFKHIHATGSRGVELFKELSVEKAFYGNVKLDVREFIDDMAVCLAAADLVICRSGALTIAELAAIGRASILIPSPNVAENHQYFNALELQEVDAAVVIEEKDLTGEKLIQIVDDLTKNPARLNDMGLNAAVCATPDTLKIIYQNIIKKQ